MGWKRHLHALINTRARACKDLRYARVRPRIFAHLIDNATHACARATARQAENVVDAYRREAENFSVPPCFVRQRAAVYRRKPISVFGDGKLANGVRTLITRAEQSLKITVVHPELGPFAGESVSHNIHKHSRTYAHKRDTERTLFFPQTNGPHLVTDNQSVGVA